MLLNASEYGPVTTEIGRRKSLVNILQSDTSFVSQGQS